jgi:hypothetical protein
MTQRRIVGLTAAAVIVIATGMSASQAQKPDGAQRSGHQEAVDRCARACSDCQRACDMCTTHCIMLITEGKKEHVKTLQTCEDCAALCSTAARIVARHGVFADLVCQACADGCARCNKQCQQFSDDKMMKACAEQCQQCEKECRAMVKHASKAEEK